MSEVIQVFLAVGVMVALGYVTLRLGQPAVLGELLAGLIIGPTVLNFLGNSLLFASPETVQTTIIKVAEIGVLLLLFSAGLEVDPKLLFAVGRPAVLGGVLGVVVPMLLMVPGV